MFIISVEEFNRQARYSSDFSGKIYHQKRLSPGVIFSIKQKEAALSYCRNWMSENPSFLCLLVEDTYQLQVWYEQLNRQSISQDEPKNSSKENADLLLKSRELQIDRKFVEGCQQILTDFIGPIAKIVVKKVVSQNPRCDREEFILRLIQELPQERQKELTQPLKQLISDS